MAELADVRRIAMTLPDAAERQTSGGTAWFIRAKPFVWECHPWPSTAEPARSIIARELVVGVSVADALDVVALREMRPDVFLGETTRWGGPKVAFRMASIDDDHLEELIVESWRTLAPRFLVRRFDGDM